MKILYLHRTQGEEPESVHIRSIAQALRDLGNEVTIVGPVEIERGGHEAGGSDRRKKPSISSIKAKLPRSLFELIQILYNVPFFLKSVRAILRLKPDLIYERYALNNLGGALAAGLFNVPHFLEFNTAYAESWKQYFGLKFSKISTWMENLILRSSDHVFVVSEFLRHKVRDRGISERNITVTHNAVDLKLFDKEISGDTVKNAFSIRKDRFVVGFVGKLNRWHGIEALVRCAVLFRETGKDMIFLIVGDGEGLSLLKERIKGYGLDGTMICTGRIPHTEIPSYIAAMDVGVMPDSNLYGSPMKIFEYMAMAKTVIAPRVPAVEEIIEHGKDGILISGGDSQELFHAIDSLQRDPSWARNLREAGYQKVKTRYLWRENAKRILEAAERTSH